MISWSRDLRDALIAHAARAVGDLRHRFRGRLAAGGLPVAMVGVLAAMLPAHPAVGGLGTHLVVHNTQRSLHPRPAAAPTAAVPAPRPDALILDRGEFPGIDTCQAAAKQAHATGWMVYIGGPSLAFDPWPQESAAQLIRRGLGVLPVYAAGSVTSDSGAEQGVEAASLAARYGIPPASLILLDVEPEVYRSAPDATKAYVRDWNRAVRAHGYRPSTYSTSDGLAAVAALGADSPDAAVVAAYPRPNELWGPPSTADAPIAGWPQARGWQFTAEVTLAGVNVDLTSVNFPLASAPEKEDKLAETGKKKGKQKHP